MTIAVIRALDVLRYGDKPKTRIFTKSSLEGERINVRVVAPYLFLALETDYCCL